jgi:hypothetical protein
VQRREQKRRSPTQVHRTRDKNDNVPVHAATGKVIETHDHVGDFKERRKLLLALRSTFVLRFFSNMAHSPSL